MGCTQSRKHSPLLNLCITQFPELGGPESSYKDTSRQPGAFKITVTIRTNNNREYLFQASQVLFTHESYSETISLNKELSLRGQMGVNAFSHL